MSQHDHFSTEECTAWCPRWEPPKHYKLTRAELDLEPPAKPDEERRVTSPTGGQKGTKLARFDLIPPDAMRVVAEVYGKGAEKYEANNWRRGYDWSLAYAAMMRHLHAFWNGEDLDRESGLPHLAHAVFHCLTLLTFMVEHPQYDDRWGGGR